MLKEQNGYISLCCYCGEQVGNTQKYCKNCKTQEGRKKIFDENVAIFKENKEKGHPVPTELRSWK
jgi:predicted amidophosphoribosyltransferase